MVRVCWWARPTALGRRETSLSHSALRKGRVWVKVLTPPPELPAGGKRNRHRGLRKVLPTSHLPVRFCALSVASKPKCLSLLPGVVFSVSNIQSELGCNVLNLNKAFAPPFVVKNSYLTLSNHDRTFSDPSRKIITRPTLPGLLSALRRGNR